MSSLFTLAVTPAYLILLLVFIFPLLSHPLAMGLDLLILTIIIALILGPAMPSYWLAYCLVLILVGGLLVIFVYVSLLASNETFSLPLKKGILLVFFACFGGFLLSQSHLEGTWTDPLLGDTMESLWLDIEDWLAPLYSGELGPLTVFIVLYLLLRLLVVVFNTKSSSATLRRQKN